MSSFWVWRVSSQAMRSTLLEDVEGAEGDVAEVADGSGYEIETGRKGCSFVRQP